MRLLALALAAWLVLPACAQDALTIGDRARDYLIGLVRLDTTNPPGRETRAAEYLKGIAAANGIDAELLGDDPARLNFVARLRGTGRERPLLLMAHTDVVPADRAQWSVDPFGALIRDGYLYGRGAEDTKDLLAVEMAVLVEVRRRGLKLKRDVILLAEADEEAGSTGMRWLVENAWEKIDAEFALNEAGTAFDTPTGTRVFQIQTSEKIPTRVTLTARGTAGHGAVPRPDNSVVRLARATVRLAEADQPVRLNSTTRRYLKELTRLPDYRWLTPLLAGLESPSTANSTGNRIRARDPELDSLLRTTAVPTVLRAGDKVNVIPNLAEAQIDVRRLPGESQAEVIGRIRWIVNDSAVDVNPSPGPQMPPAEPSSLSNALYTAMERIFGESHSHAMVIPYMSRGATDSAFLRAKGVAAYGVPIFHTEAGGDRAHGNDERRSIENLRAGSELLMKIVLAVAAE